MRQPRRGPCRLVGEVALSSKSDFRISGCPNGDTLTYIETVTKYRQLGINLIIGTKLDFQVLIRGERC